MLYGLLCASLESGILLYSCRYEASFGFGATGKDEYQLASTLFAIYTATERTLEFTSRGETSLHFCKDERAGLLMVVFAHADFSTRAARDLVGRACAVVAAHGLSTTHSPRQSTLKEIRRELDAQHAETLRRLFDKVKPTLCRNSRFVSALLVLDTDEVPAATAARAPVEPQSAKSSSATPRKKWFWSFRRKVGDAEEQPPQQAKRAIRSLTLWRDSLVLWRDEEEGKAPVGSDAEELARLWLAEAPAGALQRGAVELGGAFELVGLYGLALLRDKGKAKKEEDEVEAEDVRDFCLFARFCLENRLQP